MIYTVKIRTNHPRTGKPYTYRLSPNGRLTTKRVYAAMIEDKGKALLIATDIMANHADLKAWIEKF